MASYDAAFSSTRNILPVVTANKSQHLSPLDEVQLSDGAIDVSANNNINHSNNWDDKDDENDENNEDESEADVYVFSPLLGDETDAGNSKTKR